MDEKISNFIDGTVIANFGFDSEVKLDNGTIINSKAPQSVGRIIVGDKVTVNQQDNGFVIQQIKPRDNLISRKVSQYKVNQIASNIDQLLIMIAPEPICGQYFIDALLIAAKQQNIHPIILLNKSDLVIYKQWRIKMKLIYKQEYWQTIDFQARQNKETTNKNWFDIITQLNRKNTLLMGQSGVGKTTFLNHLFGKELGKTQEITTTKKGKHTTSNNIAYDLSTITENSNFNNEKLSGTLIDSPGIREFILLDKQNIEIGFPEFADCFGKCAFRDCQHSSEKNCSLKEKVLSQQISKKRLNSYTYFNNLKKQT